MAEEMSHETAMVRFREEMRAVRVANPFQTAVRIAVQSQRIRFGRSIITVGGIFFAIAFLVSVMTSSVTEQLTLPADERMEITGSGVGMMLSLLAEHPKQAWLVSMSLVVCVIGIANAMLMSVTERYKEIGTMKCLGALDIFVIELFLLESGIQGLIGSLTGSIIGSLLVILGLLIGEGFSVMSLVPWAQIVVNISMGTLAGIILTLLGASFPAYRAAQMHPADAMRTEI